MRYMTVVKFTCLTAGCFLAGSTLALVAADPSPAAKKPPISITGKPAATAPDPAADPAEPEAATIRLNFRGAPIQSVLNYLGDAAGFTIVLNQPVQGTVDIWNAHPLTRTEAVEVLNFALARNGFAAIRKGRTLTIMSRESALKQNTPVKSGLNPEQIPNNSDIVTQILPLAHVSASQLIRELSPILPAGATMVANEAGNSIIITDSQANSRHLAELVKAIDSSIASISGIKVFPLKFADSKTVVSVIKELFATNASGAGGAGASGRMASPFAGFTSRMAGSTRTGGASGGSSRGSAAAKIAATADDRSNSVIVTAPDDVMPTIEELISSVDVDVDDLTELKVFHLKFADPTEMAQLLASLYSDSNTTGSNSNSRNGSSRNGSSSRTGSTSRSGSPGGSAANSNLSEREKKQSRVIAVPDSRTSSVVVTTSRDLMRQIEEMIVKLDADPSRKQKVYVYSLENADPIVVQQTLQDLFQSQQNATRNSSRNNNQTSPFVTRGTAAQSKSGTSTLRTAPRTGGN
jgi:type II secretory pathway component GspD/PulD (secretin)